MSKGHKVWTFALAVGLAGCGEELATTSAESTVLGAITFSTTDFDCFDEGAFRACPFWVQDGMVITPHFHITEGVERHHFQGNNARQGAIITALDGSRFGLCKVSVRVTGGPSNNLEIGSAFPSTNPGLQVPGYAQIPVPADGAMHHLTITGFDDLTAVYVTSRGSQDWDTFVLCSVDSDGDGVNDSDDACPDTPSGELVDADGCSIAQHCPCHTPWQTHGKYVSCVAHAANDFRDAGLIDDAGHGAIVSAAARSSCGR